MTFKMKRALQLFMVLAAVAVAVSCSQSSGSKGKPQIDFVQTEIDLGDVDVAEAKFVCDVECKNIGGDTLVIKTVLASCNCMVPDTRRQAIAPGETGHLEVRLDFTGYQPGPIERSITVYSNSADADEHEIFFHCNLK